LRGGAGYGDTNLYTMWGVGRAWLRQGKNTDPYTCTDLARVFADREGTNTLMLPHPLSSCSKIHQLACTTLSETQKVILKDEIIFHHS